MDIGEHSHRTDAYNTRLDFTRTPFYFTINVKKADKRCTFCHGFMILKSLDELSLASHESLVQLRCSGGMMSQYDTGGGQTYG